MAMSALEKLHAARKRSGSLLSVGLEPCPEYQPAGFAANLEGYEEFLRVLIETTQDSVCAYKANLAHFEALGWEGMELLYCIREMIPPDVLFIADAKRGDIGSTAKHYATALFDRLESDAVTVNPLMGHDSAAPFLDYKDRLTFFLVVTSNPGANDFLLPNNHYQHMARTIQGWSDAGNVGFVAGATQPEQFAALRSIAPKVPFLVPGIGAQGGNLEQVLRNGRIDDNDPGVIIHVTRGILPGPGDEGSVEDIITEKIDEWNRRIANILREGRTS